MRTRVTTTHMTGSSDASHGHGTPRPSGVGIEVSTPVFVSQRRGRPRNLPGSLHLGTSRAEAAAQKLGQIAASSSPGVRLGSKDELRAVCGVSVGTFNEAIKLSLERGFISSRPGPGGGIFAIDPPPLARLVTWFRAAAHERDALEEALRIRDEITPMFIDAVLEGLDGDRRAELNDRIGAVRRMVAVGDIVESVWAVWDMHKFVADTCRSSLLTSLYLSLLDVGASYLRWTLQPGDRIAAEVPVWLTPFEEAHSHFVETLCAGDAHAAREAMNAINPMLLLEPPVPSPIAVPAVPEL